ncbi:MFS transporter [Kutzneria sp. 744]|uniref:MFS transporter n=1 Tax=Kutzneria sp. (strain 744) TaxID=345341 RepID=UPI0003EEB699|nr:MFS transporter [Kutzneria sp. 744]EWM18464.1 drug transporter [Kutzneria sp. 744]
MVNTSQLARRSGRTLLVLSGAPFLASLDLFVVNVAFTAIGRDFQGHSLADLSWILNGYPIIYAALLVPCGRWADRVGHKRVFLLGLAVFTLASAAAAASPNLAALIAFRLVQAAGAGALTPTSLGLLIHAVPPEDRARSVRIWASIGALASALGPVVGGFLVELSWRWVFLINVPIGIALLVLGFRVIRDYRAEETETGLDIVGAVLLTVGIGALALGLVEGSGWGWTSPGILGSLALAAATLIAFAVNNKRHRSPIIPPSLLRVRSFVWSTVAVTFFSATFGAGLLSRVFWLQDVWGYSAVQTGLAIAPGPLMVPVFAMVAQALNKRVSPGALASIGCLLWTVGTLYMLLAVGPEPHYLTEMLPAWLITGVGVGLALPTMLSSATAELPPARSGTGSAVVNMARQIGTVFGIALLVAILGSPIGYDQQHKAFTDVFWMVTIIGIVAAVASLGLTQRKAGRPSKLEI